MSTDLKAIMARDARRRRMLNDPDLAGDLLLFALCLDEVLATRKEQGRKKLRNWVAGVGRTVIVKCAYCETNGSIVWHDNCRYWPVIDGLELDHVIPEYHGGPNTADNITLACRACNRKKGHRR